MKPGVVPGFFMTFNHGLLVEGRLVAAQVVDHLVAIAGISGNTLTASADTTYGADSMVFVDDGDSFPELKQGWLYRSVKVGNTCMPLEFGSPAPLPSINT